MSEVGPWGAVPAEPIGLVVRVTLGDRVAFQRFYRTLPVFRWGVVRLVTIAAFAAPFIALVVCGLVLLALVRLGIDVGDLLAPADRIELFRDMLIAVLVVEAVAGGICALVWRAGTERRCRARLLMHPRVSCNDPEFAERLQIYMDEKGIMCTSADWSLDCKWGSCQCFGETAALFVVLTNLRNGILVPKRDLDSATIEEIRQLLAAKLPTRPKAFGGVAPGQIVAETATRS